MLFSSGRVCGQTASTGAVTGTALDSCGATLPAVIVELAGKSEKSMKSVVSDENGRFGFTSASSMSKLSVACLWSPGTLPRSPASRRVSTLE